MAIKALLFDLDDTLHDFLHSERTAQRICSTRLAGQLGLDEALFYRKLIEVNTTQLDLWLRENWFASRTMIAYRACVWGGTLQALGRECTAAALQQIAADFERERRLHMRIFPDTLPCLRALRPHYQLGVISNGPVDAQRRNAEQMDLINWFDVLLFEGELGYGKPGSRIFEEACDRLRVHPAEAVMIGDSLRNDVGGGAAAGLRTVWLKRPGESILATTSQYEPDAIIAGLAELPDALAQLESASDGACQAACS